MKARKAQITLGEGWRQFAFDRPDLEYLGVIRRGIEIGTAAKERDGALLQVKRDMRRPSAEQRAAVVITIKPKRRVIARCR